MALLLSISDYTMRLNVLKALSTGQLDIQQVFPYPESKLEIVRKTFRRLISKSDRSKFFLSGPSFSTVVMIADKNIWEMVYKIQASP